MSTQKGIELTTKKHRVVYLDLLKVIALLLMPCIHVMAALPEMELISPNFPVDSITTHGGILYLFVPGVFMFCMGCGLQLSNHSTPSQLMRRGLHLLLVGFILNILRGTLIFVILGFVDDPSCFHTAWFWLWGSDILYFAGLFFLLFAFVKRFKVKDIWILGGAVLMLIVGHFIPAFTTGIVTLDEIIGNLVYVNADSYFPVLSWSIYPVLGYVFQKKIEQTEKKDGFVLRVGLVSAAVFLVLFLALKLSGNMQDRYLLWGEMGARMDLPTALLTISFEGIYISLIYAVCRWIKSEKLMNVLGKISARVNSIYCIHWLIVSYGALVWALLIDCRVENIGTNYVIGVVVFLMSVGLSFLSRKKKACATK